MMRNHWTARYLWDRSREWLFQRQHPDAPWLGPKAVKTLEALLQPHMRGVECGAGRSTPWVAQRVAFLESWEENPAWQLQVEALLGRKRLRNVRLCAVCPQEAATWNYAERMQDTLVAQPDFALIDSEHHRDVLALHFARTLAPGGFLMLDNANWFLPSHSRSPHSRKPGEGPANEQWAAFLQAVSDWPLTWTSSGVTDTAFFRKP